MHTVFYHIYALCNYVCGNTSAESLSLDARQVATGYWAACPHRPVVVDAIHWARARIASMSWSGGSQALKTWSMKSCPLATLESNYNFVPYSASRQETCLLYIVTYSTILRFWQYSPEEVNGQAKHQRARVILAPGTWTESLQRKAPPPWISWCEMCLPVWGERLSIPQSCLFRVELVAHLVQLQSLQSEKVQSFQATESCTEGWWKLILQPISNDFWDEICTCSAQSSGHGFTIVQFCCSSAPDWSQTCDLRWSLW